ncbi:hypothetical protein SCHPADRAFT_818851 [Schizopora paradoxa]|uniref:Uncharacterized protein n=1 Tax=Schizopora paradoxa TaxID=27342 RepID=A0A0H2S546_9AGAM|nr:hypothetical protein SCHPADRAFT_818851 [Schizopora paradoxa]
MLTDLQEDALARAKELLQNAGLRYCIVPDQEDPQRQSGSNEVSQLPLVRRSCLAPYFPPPARALSFDEVANRMNQLTRKTSFCAFIEHPKGSVLEYPETGAHSQEAVVHRIPFTDFDIDEFSNSSQKWFAHPKGNIQYSLGGKHGGYTTKCAIGLPEDPTRVDCCVVSLSCMSLKVCDFSPQDLPSHSYFSGDWRSHSAIDSGASGLQASEVSHSAGREVFDRTMSFYCAVSSIGCAFSDDTWILQPRGSGTPHSDVDAEEMQHFEVNGHIFDDLGDAKCTGNIIYDSDFMGHAVVRCEHASAKRRAHLVLRNLDGFNLPYLSALFSGDLEDIARYENNALHHGYGPLVPCTFTASSSQKKQYCINWHRLGDQLVRGELHRSIECPAHFYFYYAKSAEDREQFPFYLLVCQNPHSHPPPPPTTTPRDILRPFISILKSLSWRLADATPRRLLLDHGFMSSLRSLVGWTKAQDPFLSNLHPSLGNHSHVNRIILELREEMFPHGTGLESLIAMQIDHEKLPVAQRYIRFAGTVDLGSGDMMRMVICMTRDMSFCLLLTKRATIDTSFQRIHGLDEFEIEFWDNLSQKSTVAARVFTSSQTANAHFQIFTNVFRIAEGDSGLKLKLHYMHGEGLELITADGHRGQALGMGKFLCTIARGNRNLCYTIPDKTWEQLTEWQHINHIYRYCEVHFKRNILKLRGKISFDVERAMLSLCSAHPLRDYNATLDTIRNGAWLEDKLLFALAAIYRPASFIPLEIWSAGPSTTNGNEQSHRNIYRDGVQLTALAGAMRGYEYDRRAVEARQLAKHSGIFARDIVPTQEYRQSRSIHRAVNVRKKQVDDADRKLDDLNTKIADADTALMKADAAIQRAAVSGKDTTKQLTRRMKLLQKSSNLYDTAQKMSKSGSGGVKVRRPMQFSETHQPGAGTASRGVTIPPQVCCLLMKLEN